MFVSARDSEIPELVSMINLAYRGRASGWSTEAAYLEGDRTTAARLRAEIADKPSGSLLKWTDERSGALLGCVWLEPVARHDWYLSSFAVDPERQNGGLGRALLQGAETWVRARGGRRIAMLVLNVRETLIAWYERRGYSRTGATAPFPYGDNRFGKPLRDDLSFVALTKNL